MESAVHGLGISVQPGDPRGEPAISLMRELMDEEAIRYADLGADTFDSFRPEDVLSAHGAFVIACLDGHPVGCGALRPIDPDAAEINRMYVSPAVRRRGVGRALLADLERRAAGFGCRVIRLETGDRQPEAMALYEGAGFHRTTPFGSHAGDPISVFFEKAL